MLRESCTHHLESLLCEDGHTQHNSCTLPLQLHWHRASVQFIASACKCLGNNLKAAEIRTQRGWVATAWEAKGMMQKWMGKHLWTKHDHNNESCKATKANLSCPEEAVGEYISYINLGDHTNFRKKSWKKSWPCDFLGAFFVSCWVWFFVLLVWFGLSILVWRRFVKFHSGIKTSAFEWGECQLWLFTWNMKASHRTGMKSHLRLPWWL